MGERKPFSLAVLKDRRGERQKGGKKETPTCLQRPELDPSLFFVQQSPLSYRVPEATS